MVDIVVPRPLRTAVTHGQRLHWKPQSWATWRRMVRPLFLLLGLCLYCATLGASVPAKQVIISLEPNGQLSVPANFGDRCTLVDAAAVLNYYGVAAPQASLAEHIGNLAHYSEAASGIPWWAFVSWPGQRPLLDMAIQRAARDAGRRVAVHTEVGLDFREASAAISRDHPVILNVLYAPDGTPDHSVLAYGVDTRGGHALLLVIDPNSERSYWVGANTLWSRTMTSTYIIPLSPSSQGT
jgi:Peptidase_C39 like family